MLLDICCPAPNCKKLQGQYEFDGTRLRIVKRCARCSRTFELIATPKGVECKIIAEKK